VKWLAILLAMAGLGGAPTREPSHSKPKCTTSKAVKKKACKKKTVKPPTTKKPAAGTPTTPGAARPEEPATPGATPTPAPSATPGATASPKPTVTVTPTPTATPVLPRRTSVDLTEWEINSSYETLAAGRITFNANNRGEDDHNLAVRGAGHQYGQLDLGPGESGPLALDLAPGDYTLYCSLVGHEAAGMKRAIRVR
jgi:hypothetical protein